MAKPVAGKLDYDPVSDRPTVALRVGTRKVLVEGDGGGSGGEDLEPRVEALETDLAAHIGSRGSSHGLATTTEAGYFSAAEKAQLATLVAGGGAGDIEAVTAGAGLTGGGTTGAVSLAADFGSGTNQVRRGDDVAYTNARTPTAHGSTHAPNGADAIATAAPATLVVGTVTSTVGSSASLARADHVHAMAAFGTTAGTFAQGNDSRLTNARTPTAHGSTHNPGGSDAITVGTPLALAVGDTVHPGATEAVARSDHRHGLPTGTPSQLSPSSTANAGAATSVSRSDHVHGFATPETPYQVFPGTTGHQGFSLAFARADHRHQVPSFGTAVNTFCQGNDTRLLRGSVVARVHLGTAANTNTSGYQKVPIDTVGYDPSGIWVAVNKELRPLVAGYYLVNIRVRCASACPTAAAIGKNNTPVIAVGHEGAASIGVGGSGLVYCNGSSDAISAWIAASTTIAYSVSANDTWMDIHGPFG